MNEDASLLPGRLLRRPGTPKPVKPFQGVQIDDERLAGVLAPDADLLCLYEGTLHGEGPVWEPAHDRLAWSDVLNRRLLAWHSDGHVDVLIDCTYFMNGNALEADGALVHCEHGRRCISRSRDGSEATPIVTHYRGKRLNSPNDMTVAADEAIWLTDPTFGILMPNQGSLVEPELDHRSVYRFDHVPSELARMADFEQPSGWPSHRTAVRSTCPTRQFRWTRSLATRPGRPTGWKPSTSAWMAACPAGGCSIKPTTAIPTASRWTGGAEFGPRPLTASISWRPIATGSASFLR